MRCCALWPGWKDAQLQMALERLAEAAILLVQGLPRESEYRFKHALIQDAAYEILLKSRRQVLHRRVAETLRDNVAVAAGAEPELLAHHFTQAGMTEAAIEWWGKAGQRSLERSALVEAAVQFNRALDQIAELPATPALRRERIKFQVGLANALMHVKGYGAPETKAAVEQARLFIEQAEALGEPPEDSLLVFSVLYGFWIANYSAFNGDAVRELAAQFFALAEKQGTIVPLLMANRIMGASLLHMGEVAEAQVHLNRGIALYDPGEHRPLATRFGVDPGVLNLGCRSWTLWLLGYPDSALRDDAAALKQAIEIGQAATLMSALTMTSLTYICCGNYTTANAQSDETVAVADEKGAVLWKAMATLNRGWVLALTGKASDAVQTIASGIAACRSTGATVWQPFYLSYLARAYAELGQFDDAWRCIGQAITTMETTKERWCEAEINRVAGEIALLSPEPGKTKAEAYFDRALAIARRQQAKSWELRAVRPAIFLLRSTAGSPKASTRSI
jgi:predicted ATPase